MGVDKLRIIFTWTVNLSNKRSDDFSYIFPDIEILDTYRRDNCSQDEIKKLIEVGKKEKDIAFLFDAISKILHWFEYGFPTRKKYDEFASLNFGNIKLYEHCLNDLKSFGYIKLLYNAFQKRQRYIKKKDKKKKICMFFFAEEVKKYSKIVNIKTQ